MARGGQRDSAANVGGATRIVGIFGDPIDHTLSPRMHNAAYAALGLDYVYVPFRPPGRRLGAALAALPDLGVVGCNVTVPYKQKVVKHLSRISKTARAIGAVNTVVCEGRRLIGDNTDAEGFTKSLVAAGVRPRGKRVLVIGAGGSARAVVHALTAGGAESIVLANRTVSKARRLLAEVAPDNATARPGRLDLLTDRDFLASRELVVNCTSVGLEGGAFVDYTVAATPADCLHFDLAYGRKPTAFLRAASRRRRPTVDGRHMLVHQGAAAFRLFTGRRAPVDVMLEAVGL